MTTEYPAGTVAVATVRGVPNVRVVRVDYPTTPPWMSLGRHPEGAIWHTDERVTDARPLAVIDYEDRDQVERLADLLLEHRAAGPAVAHSGVAAALREYADPKPPKPEEPTGLGAVVEDAEGRRWTRYRETTTVRHWHPADGCGTERRYAEIDGVKVLSEGVL